MTEEEITFSTLQPDVIAEPMEPLEWLQFIAQGFLELAEELDDYDSHFIKDWLWDYGAEDPTTSKIVMYIMTAQYIGERLLHDFQEDCWYLSRDLEHNKKCLLKAFELSTVFPIIIDAVGTLECVMNETKDAQDGFYFYQYYCIVSTPEEAVEWFGQGADKRYKKNPKLTEDDYESAFEQITLLLKKIEEGRFSHKLRESAWRIKTYCKLKAGSEKYAETKEKIKKRKSELEKKTFSTPLGLSAWADIFHVGDNKMREWMRSKKKNRPYHFDQVSDRKWRLPKHEMPAEYLENYTKHLENIGIKKAKAKRDKNSK